MNAAQHALILCIRVYRLAISPAKLFLFGHFSGCRFEPSCSAYAIQAISRHGALPGCWLTLKRLTRCHPWGGCGHDPVPEKKSKAQSPKSKIVRTSFWPSEPRFGSRSATSPPVAASSISVHLAD